MVLIHSDDYSLDIDLDTTDLLVIDDHYRIYGKKAIDVKYGEECIFCGSRIDEYGFCACGAGGS